MSTFDEQETIIDVSDDGLNKESLLDRLRKQRQAVAEQQTTDFDIPGYQGELFCRYRLLDGTELDKIMRRVRSEIRDRNEQILAATCDNLITACEEFWVRDKGKDIPLREHPTYEGPKELPVKYDVNLADYLGFSVELPDPPTARSVVLALFGGNDIAVAAHGARLARWMMKSGLEVDAELGEI